MKEETWVTSSSDTHSETRDLFVKTILLWRSLKQSESRILTLDFTNYEYVLISDKGSQSLEIIEYI